MIRYKKLPDDIHQKMNGLKEFIETEQNIVFAYLFGGFLKDRKSPLRDIDIAIFVNNIRKLDYLDIFSRITDILGTDEVDLVVLIQLPSVFQEGYCRTGKYCLTGTHFLDINMNRLL